MWPSGKKIPRITSSLKLDQIKNILMQTFLIVVVFLILCIFVFLVWNAFLKHYILYVSCFFLYIVPNLCIFIFILTNKYLVFIYWIASFFLDSWHICLNSIIFTTAFCPRTLLDLISKQTLDKGYLFQYWSEILREKILLNLTALNHFGIYKSLLYKSSWKNDNKEKILHLLLKRRENPQ